LAFSTSSSKEDQQVCGYERVLAFHPIFVDPTNIASTIGVSKRIFNFCICRSGTVLAKRLKLPRRTRIKNEGKLEENCAILPECWREGKSAVRVKIARDEGSHQNLTPKPKTAFFHESINQQAAGANA
jgi:hypothetical protein